MSNPTVQLLESQVAEIRPKIVTALLTHLNEQQFYDLCKAEFDLFFKKGDGYSSRNDGPSSFQQVVRKELEVYTKAKVQELLSGPDFQGSWVEGKEMASKMIQEFMKENAELIFKNMMMGTFQMQLEELKSRLNRV